MNFGLKYTNITLQAYIYVLHHFTELIELVAYYDLYINFLEGKFLKRIIVQCKSCFPIAQRIKSVKVQDFSYIL